MGYDDRLAEYIAGRYGALRRSAYLLCGDVHQADDLVQSTLVKVMLAHRRLERIDSIDAYARRTMHSTFISSRRRLWHRERPHAQMPDTGTPDPDVDLGLSVRAALQLLPARQRAVVVLRFWEDLSVQATADVLGISEGTVKSHTSRAMATLRTALGEAIVDLPDTTEPQIGALT
ncbi:SigE family RNA polymerase sigma factor [Streptacidiphilus sp. EB129]|uniref:SigE family RNA polymerase sigma factor n=1 Tax=Streptacidiphilus sp. EB129 TaxID=3156262 RepID=UPI003518E5AE